MPCLPRTAPRDFRALRLAAQLQKPSAPSPPLATVTEHPRLRWGSTGMHPLKSTRRSWGVSSSSSSSSSSSRRQSASGLDSHAKWIEDVNAVSPTPRSPIVADADRKIASLGIALTIRPVFIIDSAKKIRLTTMYPASCVRDTAETLGVIGEKGVTTPTGWQVGEDVVVRPAVSTADAKRKSGEGNVREVRPYSRLTTI
ncbi:unnamed protein product [Diplocarpon coronariae]